jgi:hypothetical protein
MPTQEQKNTTKKVEESLKYIKLVKLCELFDMDDKTFRSRRKDSKWRPQDINYIEIKINELAETIKDINN